MLGILVIATGTISAAANESSLGWPHSRGPTFDAVSTETNIASSWPDEGPPVLWSRDIGVGYSGFVASDNRVFTQIQTLYSQCVVCLDADTGQELWRHRYDLPYDGSGVYPGPRATPTLADGAVYFAGPRGQIGRLDAISGSAEWTVNVIKEFDGKGMDFGYAASPLVMNGLVIVPVGGKGSSVVALDAETGRLVWKSGDQPGSYIGAIPITVDGEQHVVVFLQNSLAAVDVATGRLLWQHVFSQGYDEHAAAPIYREPHLLIASPFKSGAQIYRVSRSPNQQKLFEATWELDIPKLSNDTASSLLLGNHVYGFDLREIQAKRRRPSRGSFRCIEWPTGKIKWSEDSTGHASVIAADEKLILYNDKGEIILVAADSEQYVELGRTQVFEGEICWTAPALYRGRLFLRTPTRAACVFLGVPEQLNTEQRVDAIPTTKLPQSRPVELYWIVDGEREYPFDTHSKNELIHWFGTCMSCFLVAFVVAALARSFTTFGLKFNKNLIAIIVFWSTLFVAGIAATPILNNVLDQFCFTWPVILFSSFQLTLQCSIWANEQTNPRRSRWIARLSGIAFLGVCIGYFTLCRKLSHSTEWIFLVGFVPGAVVAIPTAYLLQSWRPIRNAACVCVAFAFYFWGSAGVKPLASLEERPREPIIRIG